MSEFENFARAFFSTLGLAPEARDGRLFVSLDPALAAHFGCRELLLTFTPHDPQGELVAYGSRRFEQMQAALATRGRLAASMLSTTSAPPTEPELLNGSCEQLSEMESPRDYFQVNYQLACLSDERIEQLRSYCLDAEGRPAPEAEAWLAAAQGGQPLDGALALPSAVEGAAERTVLQAADHFASELEAPLLERLRRVAGRLVAYYEELMADVSVRRRKGQNEAEALEAADAERWRLRRELERKLAEETARHQLRVQVRRISLAHMRVPGLGRRYRIATRHAERELFVWHNRHTGEAEWPACQRCGAQGGRYGLCAEKHLACDRCLGHCSTCNRDLCQSELAECSLCHTHACPACLKPCTTGHPVCETHIAACTCCGQAFCDACLASCLDCAGKGRLATAHSAPCAVCQATLCARHRQHCAWCGKYSCAAHTGGCPGCGDRLCGDHLGPCAQCGIAYCLRCRDLEDGHARTAHCRACMAVGDAQSAPADWLVALPHAARYPTWTAIENESYRYLLGHGLLGDCLVVMDGEGRIVSAKEIGFWRKLFGWGRP